jgi:hypothetical protein
VSQARARCGLYGDVDVYGEPGVIVPGCISTVISLVARLRPYFIRSTKMTCVYAKIQRLVDCGQPSSYSLHLDETKSRIKSEVMKVVPSQCQVIKTNSVGFLRKTIERNLISLL